MQIEDYMILFLPSGVEIIGKVKFANAELVEIDNPAAIVMQDQGNGQIGVRFVPYAPYVESVAYSRGILGLAIPHHDMISKYKQHFEPDAIIVPNKDIITTIQG